MKKKPKLNGLALANWVNDWVSNYVPNWQVTEVSALRDLLIVSFRRDLSEYLFDFAFSRSWHRKGLGLALEVKGDVLGVKYSEGLLEMIEKHYPENFNGVPSLPDIKGKNVGGRPEVKRLTKEAFYEWYRKWEASVKEQFAPKVTEANLLAFNNAFGVAFHTWLSTLYVNRDLISLPFGVNLVNGKLCFNEHIDHLLECPVSYREAKVQCVDMVYIGRIMSGCYLQVMLRRTVWFEVNDTVKQYVAEVGGRLNQDVHEHLKMCCVDPIWLTKSYTFGIDENGHLVYSQDMRDLYAAKHPKLKEEKATVHTPLLPGVESSLY